MATANPIGEDNYELEMSRVRNKVIATFRELTECLKERELVLLKELDDILASYRSYKLEIWQMKGKKKSLQRTRSVIEQDLEFFPVQNIYKDLITRLDTEIETIEMPKQPQMMYFLYNNNILDEVKKLGEFVKQHVIDYQRKIKPVVSVCDYGRELNNMYGPKAVTVDTTSGKIFVADTNNNCIKVFDDSGKILYKFGDENEEMYMPQGLSIYGNTILITQQTNFILSYNLNGEFISRIGKFGNGKLEFNRPHGLTFDQNGELYICDSQNNRVQILSKEFKFKDTFGQNCLKNPLDVKLTRKSIFILDVSNPCLHLFNYNLILQKSVLSRGEGLQLHYPRNCCIDSSDNILISDSIGLICIFNPEFELIHRITITDPSGVTVDQRRIIVVCEGGNKRLNIF